MAQAGQLVAGSARTNLEPMPPPLIHRQDGSREGLCLPVGEQRSWWRSHPLVCPCLVQLVPLTIQPLQHFLEDGVRSCAVRGLLPPLPGPMGPVLPAGPAEQTSDVS